MIFLRLQSVLLFAFVTLLMFGGPTLSSGAEDTTPRSVVLLSTLSEEAATQRQIVTKLNNRIASAKENMLEILNKRLSHARENLLKKNLTFVEKFIAKQNTGEVDAFKAQAIKALQENLSLADTVYHGFDVQQAMPQDGLSASVAAAAYAGFFSRISKFEELCYLLKKNIDYSRSLGIDVKDDEVKLQATLDDFAASLTILLEFAAEDMRGYKAGVAVLPGDEELKAQLALSINKIHSMGRNLNNIIDLMDDLGIVTSGYKSQALAATGQISAKTFDTGVMKRLIASWGNKITVMVIEKGPDLLIRIFLFLGIILLFAKFSRIVKKITFNALQRTNSNLSVLLQRMLVSVAGNAVFLLGGLIALSQVGISLGPLLAGLGVAGFIIGFAMQDVLSNFASGLMILFYRPFDVDDMVDVAGVFGQVSDMSLVNTTILTPDNQRIVVPNNKIWGDVIKNVTSQTVRRVDMVFGISYDDDISRAEDLLKDVLASSSYVLSDPEPLVRVDELADSSVNFVVRPWVKTEDYWDALGAITKAVKIRFDAEGISIPFPQQDTHIKLPEPLAVQLAAQVLAATEVAPQNQVAVTEPAPQQKPEVDAHKEPADVASQESIPADLPGTEPQEVLLDKNQKPPESWD